MMIRSCLHNKLILIDLDGTMYRGNDVIPSALIFIKYLQKERIPFLFVTNNATRTHAQNRVKMESLGFHDIKDSQFFTIIANYIMYFILEKMVCKKPS